MKKKILISIVLIASIIASTFLIKFVSRKVAFQEVNLNGIKVDVGSFEDYSSSSSSSHSSGYSSSSHDYSRSYGGSGYSGGGYSGSSGDSDISLGTLVVIIIVIFIIIAISKAKDKKVTKMDDEVVPTYTVGNQNLTMENHDDEVSRRIKEHDKEFDIEEFKAFAKTTFIKLQNAWTERDWEKVRVLESDKLFEQHKAQLQGYIDNNQINVIERIMVNEAHLYNFTQVQGKDTLTIDLKTRMADYIIDASTKKVIRGDKFKETYHIYRLTFVKTEKTKATEGEEIDKKEDKATKTTNCPNCGAPTEITSTGRCPYCHSVITTKEYDWVLDNLERPQ